MNEPSEPNPDPAPPVWPPKSTNPEDSPTVIFVIGAPGAGKGTLCKKHPVEKGYTHLSVGDYLRELCADGADTTSARQAGLSIDEIRDTMKQASQLLAEPLVELLRLKILEECRKGKRKFVIDGFPRTLESAKLFENRITKPSMVIHVDCKSSTAKERFLARGREAGDDAAKFDTRYAKFLTANAAILEWYGELISELNTDCGEEESHKAMLGLIEYGDSTRRNVDDVNKGEDKRPSLS